MVTTNFRGTSDFKVLCVDKFLPFTFIVRVKREGRHENKQIVFRDIFCRYYFQKQRNDLLSPLLSQFAPWRSHNSLRKPRKNAGVWQPSNIHSVVLTGPVTL